MAYGALAYDFDQELNEELEELLAQRDTVLAQYPELKEIQGEIDELLGKTCNPSTRLDIVFMLLAEKLDELQNAVHDLESDTRRFS